MTETPVNIALGDPRQSELGNRNARIDHQPVGMDFYERRWPVNDLGQVRYLQGDNSFDIPRVSGVMGSSYPDQPERGIVGWSVRAFPMEGDRIPHQLARDRLFELFAQLQQAGWRRRLIESSPRLRGPEAVRYAIDRLGIYSLDPDYIPDMQEWRELNLHLPYWEFWAGGTYMSVQVIDEPALRNRDTPGVYMFSIQIDSEAEHFRKYFDVIEVRPRWKQLVPAEIERMHQTRAATEEKMAGQGYTIDTTYTDPPILALQARA